MKKLLNCIVASLIVAVFFVSGCFLFGGGGEKRGRLDTADIPVIELGDEDGLLKDKTFTSSATYGMYDFTFASSADVKLFKYRAYYNGTYNFSVYPACDVSIYIHSGNIITDWWQELPCKHDLNKGLEYSIEIRLNDGEQANKELSLRIDTPSTETKDISDCYNFIDEHVQGETAYYSFTAVRDGKHYFTFNGFDGKGRVKVFKNNQQISDTAWATTSIDLKTGESVAVQVTPPKSYAQSIYGIVKHPAPTVDITEKLKEKQCVILKLTPVYEEHGVIIKVRAGDGDETYQISKWDVGAQLDGGRPELMAGYGELDFKIGDSWRGNRDGAQNLFVDGGSSATFEIKGPSKVDDKKYYLTVFKNGVDKTYHEYID